MRWSHFRIERDGSGKLSLRFFPTLESGKCITELKMCEGIIGAFRNIFLKRIDGSREIIFVDRLLRLLKQWRERIFLGLRRRLPRGLRGRFALRLCMQ